MAPAEEVAATTTVPNPPGHLMAWVIMQPGDTTVAEGATIRIRVVEVNGKQPKQIIWSSSDTR